MDKPKLLTEFTTAELTGELQRRIAELDRARVLLMLPSTGKNPRVSAAKTQYWKAWHEYSAAHPGATVAEWRKSQKHKAK
jgi:hypothetical protein